MHYLKLLVTGYSYGVVSYKASQALRPFLICCAPPSVFHPSVLSACSEHLAVKQGVGEKCPWIFKT
jgi:hypothetical protein